MEADESHTCKKSRAGASGNGSGGEWNNPASRIYRVSQASGGKDRHSKVYTSKGLRNRRVRLSVSAAIHLYDLQDRLGFDQPSKAIEWLIKAAGGAIAELPALESSLLDPPKEMNFVLEMEAEGEGRKFNRKNSGSSSTSETTKGSVLSISQSEICVKARQRAAEEKDQDGGINQRIDSRSSFTELLDGDSGGNCGIVTVAETESRKPNCYLQGTATADYFAQGGVFSQLQKSNQSSSCAGLTALGSSRFPMNMATFNTGAAAVATQRSDHSEMQHFSFMQDHPVPLAAVAAGDDFNLNFSLSPGLAGFNRETLQSNSSESQLHHHRHSHLSYPINGSKIPFFGATSPAAATGASQSQFLGRFDGGLQLYYGEGCRHSDLNC